MKHLNSTTGISMSEAQTISNFCNQKAKTIEYNLNVINNASKTVKIEGETYFKQKGVSIPNNIIDLLEKKGKYHAFQAFLMSNIKEKDRMIEEIQSMRPELKEQPELPQIENDKSLLKETVDSSWGFQQLTNVEYKKYLIAEAYASHIGQFIHKDGKLDALRKELPNLSELEFIDVENNKKTPMRVTIHHTSEQLSEVYEQLIKKHREYEKEVNYFKAKVKNLVSDKNAEISNHNAKIQDQWKNESQEAFDEFRKQIKQINYENEIIKSNLETLKQEKMKEIKDLKISIPEDFSDIYEEFKQK